MVASCHFMTSGFLFIKNQMIMSRGVRYETFNRSWDQEDNHNDG